MTIGKIIGIVSALAMMVALTAYSEANAASAAQPLPTTGEMSAKQSPILWGIQEDMQQNWNQVKADFQADKADLQDGWNDETAATAAVVPPVYNARTTATGMLGQLIVDVNGKKIATLKDIILDSTGRAALAVVTDGGFMGVGDKLAALDYALIVNQAADGDLMMPIGKDTLKKAAAFSYDTKEVSADIQVIPNNGYSVAQLIRGKLLRPDGQALGNIENVIFRGGEASQVIVAFGKPGAAEKAALDFDDLTLARQADGTLDFRMNESQAAQFETYKAINAN